MKQPKYFQLEIITPDRPPIQEQVIQVIAPGKRGRFGVLVRHAPALIELTVGTVEVQAVSGNRTFTISGGVAEIRNNVMKLLVASAEDAEAIDVARAEQARDRALARLKARQEHIDIYRAQASLARAINRLNAARKHFR